jgi:hypothetical protein
MGESKRTGQGMGQRAGARDESALKGGSKRWNHLEGTNRAGIKGLEASVL